jgi:tRNA (guanine-N7-)-methyltransferase
MGHDKLRKFAENETFSCLLQPSAQELLADGYFHLRDHSIKGNWNNFFCLPVAGSPRQNFALRAHPSQPDGWAPPVHEATGGHGFAGETGNPAAREIVLELGCGKGEYTVALAERDPDRNYIGVDIKGARLWKGAKYATEHALPNVAFLRTRVEFITAFFAPGEVSEIWLTFSDPQYRSENSRLSSPLFLERYRSFMKPGGIVHLKTDSRFLHEYTRAVCEANGLKILSQTTDLYGQQDESIHPAVREVKTFYEQLFLEQGYPITYLSFVIDHEGPYVSPRDPEQFDSKAWRAAEGPRLLFGHDSAETRRQKLHAAEEA